MLSKCFFWQISLSTINRSANFLSFSDWERDYVHQPRDQSCLLTTTKGKKMHTSQPVWGIILNYLHDNTRPAWFALPDRYNSSKLQKHPKQSPIPQFLQWGALKDCISHSPDSQLDTFWAWELVSNGFQGINTSIL